MPRAAIIAMLISLVAAPGAAAKSIRVTPDPCPIPADIAPLVSEDIGTYDLNPWTDRFENELLFRDIPVAGGAATMRLFVDPVTGEIVDPPLELTECAAEQGWPQ